MTISRVKPGNWGVGDKLTSAQENGVDANTSYALDKRAGQTDTLASVATLTGAGRFIPSVTAGANADTTYQVGSGVVIRVTSTVNADRVYTLGTTSVQTNDVLTFYCESSFANKITIKDQASATMFVLGNASSCDGRWCRFIYIAGWRILEGGQGSRIVKQTFTSNGTFTAPPGVTSVILEGCGGGGGGGGGGPAAALPDVMWPGGAGGGGAMLCRKVVTVTPGSNYAVTIGAGGAGGNSSPSPGANGGSTIIGSLATFKGGQGGGNAPLAGSVSTISFAFGGSARAGTVRTGYGQTISHGSLYPAVFGSPGQGGFAVASGLVGRVYDGSDSDDYTGGAPGTTGANSGTYYAGTGGGGGAAGPYGAGAAGGNGGDGNGAGVGGNGTNGSSASANTGSGGGGAGAGGFSNVTGGNGATGGDGGSGQLTVIWVM